MVLGLRKKSEGQPIEAVQPETTASPSAADSKAVDAAGLAQSSSINIDNDEIVEDSVEQLKKFQKLHQWDLNLPLDKLYAVDAALDSNDVEKKVHVEQNLLAENSPYPEVAAAVRNYDEYVILMGSFIGQGTNISQGHALQYHQSMDVGHDTDYYRMRNQHAVFTPKSFHFNHHICCSIGCLSFRSGMG